MKSWAELARAGRSRPEFPKFPSFLLHFLPSKTLLLSNHTKSMPECKKSAQWAPEGLMLMFWDATLTPIFNALSRSTRTLCFATCIWQALVFCKFEPPIMAQNINLKTMFFPDDLLHFILFHFILIRNENIRFDQLGGGKSGQERPSVANNSKTRLD